MRSLLNGAHVPPTFVLVILLTINLPLVANSRDKGVSHNEKRHEISGIVKAVSELTTAVRRLLSNVITESNQCELTFDDMTADVISSLGNIIAEVANVGKTLMQQSFSSLASDQLQNANQKLQAMSQKFDITVQFLNESLINHTEDLDRWTAKLNDELRYINQGPVFNTVCEVVNDMIQISTIQLHNCCNIKMKPMVSLCHSFRALLGSVFGVMADVLHRIQECLEDKRSYYEYMTPCLELAYDETVKIIDGAMQLRRKLTKLLKLKLLYSKCCVSLVYVDTDDRNGNYVIEEYTNE